MESSPGDSAPLVLVVEDQSLIRLNMVDTFEDAGFEVVEATDADLAIAILVSREDVGLLLTDIDMPGSMDGLKLAAYVAKRWPSIKVMVTSGHTTPEEGDLPEGGLFVPKPHGADEIVRIASEMIGDGDRARRSRPAP